MVRKMLHELTLFLVMMFMFLLAHGVLLNSFTNPNAEYEGFFQMLWAIFYIPYFQIFGELFLENLENEPEQVFNSTDYFENTCCSKGIRSIVMYIVSDSLDLFFNWKKEDSKSEKLKKENLELSKFLFL